MVCVGWAGRRLDSRQSAENEAVDRGLDALERFLRAGQNRLCTARERVANSLADFDNLGGAPVATVELLGTLGRGPTISVQPTVRSFKRYLAEMFDSGLLAREPLGSERDLVTLTGSAEAPVKQIDAWLGRWSWTRET